MANNFRQNVVSAIKWNALGQVGRQIISFLLMIVLTRILLPEEFGQIGILLVFIGLADVFINSGLSVALIQRKENTTTDYSTVFIFNIVVSTFFYLTLFFCAPLIANFFHQPELLNLSRIISLVFVINSFGTVQNTILSIELNFKRQNLISIVGILCSAAVSLFMALNGYGVYSLVGQTITFALITNILLWQLSPWRPQLVFSKESFRSLFSLGSKVLGSSILDKLFTTVDNLIVGKIFNTTQLGFYTRGKATRDLPIQNTTGIFSSMFFPVFSKITDEDELRRYHLKFLGIIAYVIFPLMSGLIVVAEPFTISIFTDKWAPSIPMLQIFCLYGPIYPLSVVLVQSLLIRGHATKFLVLDIYKKIILLFGMIIGAYFGVFGFLIALCISNYLGFILNIIFSSNALKIPILEYVKCLVPSIIVSILMGLIVMSMNWLEYPSALVQLIVQSVTGIITYTLLSKIFKLTEFSFLVNLVLKRKQR